MRDLAASWRRVTGRPTQGGPTAASEVVVVLRRSLPEPVIHAFCGDSDGPGSLIRDKVRSPGAGWVTFALVVRRS